jgi:hypothetical protein
VYDRKEKDYEQENVIGRNPFLLMRFTPAGFRRIIASIRQKTCIINFTLYVVEVFMSGLD